MNINMKKWCLAIILVCFTLAANAQTAAEHWAQWNTNYPATDITSVLKQERQYADSVEHHPNIAPYYVRKDKYRFTGVFMGKVQPVSADSMNSVNRVFKTLSINATAEDLFDSAVLIKVGNEEIWMPIQKKLIDEFQKDLKNGDKVTLYCLYLNEHTSKNVLFNHFIISEYSPE